jgi:hypothetical protein
LLMIVVNFCLKFPFCSPFFHGREYEDCFVHQAVARQLEQNKINGDNSFRESIVSAGNIDSGDSRETFHHYIGYPTVIHIVDRIFGERTQSGHIVSLIAACFNVVLVFLLASIMILHPSFPYIASAVYTLLPLGTVYAASTSAEILSSFYVTLVLLQIYLLADKSLSRFASVATYIGLCSCMIFSILVKRENTLLLILFPICYFFINNTAGHITSCLIKIIKTAFLVIIPILFFQLVFLDLYFNVREEACASANRFFTVKNLFVLGPEYILSLGQFKFYMVFGIVLLTLPVVWYKFQTAKPVIFAFLGYLFMYSAHYRSYYYLQNYATSMWDTVRYMLSMLPVIALLSSICIVYVFSFICDIVRLRLIRPLIIGSMIFLCLFSIYTSFQLRTNLTDSEQEEVIKPALCAIKTLINKNNRIWIFTSRPCLYQIYGPRNLNLVDLTMVNKLGNEHLDTILDSAQAYACLTSWDLNPVNVSRYAEQMKWLREKESSTTLMFDGMTIVRLH